jgi:hypothetical protein
MMSIRTTSTSLPSRTTSHLSWIIQWAINHTSLVRMPLLTRGTLRGIWIATRSLNSRNSSRNAIRPKSNFNLNLQRLETSAERNSLMIVTRMMKMRKLRLKRFRPTEKRLKSKNRRRSLMRPEMPRRICLRPKRHLSRMWSRSSFTRKIHRRIRRQLIDQLLIRIQPLSIRQQWPTM